MMKSESQGNQASSPAYAEAISRNPARNVESLLTLFFSLCAASYLYVCHVSVMWMDELYSYFTDHVATIWDVIHVQMTSPITLDPPLTHIIQHLSLVAGHGELLVYRLPSFLFCLLMFVSVYLYMRRLGGIYLAAFTVGVLMLRGVVTGQFFSARPYALLLAASGIAMLLWQNSIRGIYRWSSLIGLFLALGIGVATHYYGVLLPVLFLLIEMYRSLERRTIDLPIVGATLGSFVFALSWVGCMRAAKQYRNHYYDAHTFSLAEIYGAFSSPLSGPMAWKQGPHPGTLFLSAQLGFFLLLISALLFGLYVGYKGALESSSRRTEWVALGGITFLPLLGIAVSHITGATYEPRFTLEQSIGVAAAFSAAALFCVRWLRLRNGLLLLLCMAVAGRTFLDLRSSLVRRAATSGYVAKLNQSSLGKTGKPTVFADLELYLLLNSEYRNVSPFMSKMIWVYDLDRSVSLSGMDTVDRTVMNLGKFTPLDMVTYNDFVRANRTFQLFLFNPPRATWLADSIHADGGSLRPVETIPDTSGLIGNNALYEVQMPLETKLGKR